MNATQHEQGETTEPKGAHVPIWKNGADTPGLAAEAALNAVAAIFSSPDKVMSPSDFEWLNDSIKNLHIAHMLAVAETLKTVDRSPAFTWSGHGGAKEVFTKKYNEAVGDFTW